MTEISLLGAINFLLIQWFFVRIAFFYDDNDRFAGLGLLGFIVPLTGWSAKWSPPYKWLGRWALKFSTYIEPELRPVIVCTKYRGVFFGYGKDTRGKNIDLKAARMIISWGTSRGLLELAHTGPTGASEISAPADAEIRGVTAVFELAPEAVKAWSAVK